MGLATSPDGATWTKHDDPATTERPFAASDPVLVAPGLVEDPSVMRTDAGRAMVFRTGGGLRFAGSADGVRWAVDEGDLIVRGGEGNEIFFSALVRHEGTAYLYFEAGGADTSVYMATWEE